LLTNAIFLILMDCAEDGQLRERRSPIGLFGGGGVHKGGGHYQQHAHHYKETYGFGPFHASFSHADIKGHGAHYGAGIHKGPAHFHNYGGHHGGYGGYHGGHYGGGGGLGLFSYVSL
jgi:hypothetical protein